MSIVYVQYYDIIYHILRKSVYLPLSFMLNLFNVNQYVYLYLFKGVMCPDGKMFLSL